MTELQYTLLVQVAKAVLYLIGCKPRIELERLQLALAEVERENTLRSARKLK